MDFYERLNKFSHTGGIQSKYLEDLEQPLEKFLVLLQKICLGQQFQFLYP